MTGMELVPFSFFSKMSNDLYGHTPLLLQHKHNLKLFVETKQVKMEIPKLFPPFVVLKDALILQIYVTSDQMSRLRIHLESTCIHEAIFI